jgi:hypothetical protein
MAYRPNTIVSMTAFTLLLSYLAEAGVASEDAIVSATPAVLCLLPESLSLAADRLRHAREAILRRADETGNHEGRRHHQFWERLADHRGQTVGAVALTCAGRW